MKKYDKYLKYILYFFSIIFIVLFFYESKAISPSKLLNNSVMISANNRTGSGSVFINEFCFIWTCWHVVLDAENIIVKDNDCRQFLADIIVSSKEQDIALLKLIGKSPFKSGIKFTETIPEINSTIYHIGCPSGTKGFNSFFEGKISFINRTRDNGFTYDQINCGAFYGCSGGGVYNKKGEYIGFVAEFLNSNTHGMFCIIPSRRIVEFARLNNVEYAVNTDVPVPIDEIE